MSLDAVRQAITKAVTAENWQIESSGEQSLRVRFVRGKHTIWVRIAYDHTTFSLLYDRSDNMSYWKSEIGRHMIHPSYNAWVHNLRLAILYELEKM